MQPPKAQMVKFGMSKGDPDVTTDSLKPNDAVTIMLRDSGFTPPELGVQYGEPFAVAEGGGMLRCDRYPQEGGNGQKWYFRLCVSRGLCRKAKCTRSTCPTAIWASVMPTRRN